MIAAVVAYTEINRGQLSKIQLLNDRVLVYINENHYLSKDIFTRHALSIDSNYLNLTLDDCRPLITTDIVKPAPQIARNLSKYDP